MTATPATTEAGPRRWGSGFFSGTSTDRTQPHAAHRVLPAAALLLRLGQDDLLGPDGLAARDPPKLS